MQWRLYFTWQRNITKVSEELTSRFPQGTWRLALIQSFVAGNCLVPHCISNTKQHREEGMSCILPETVYLLRVLRLHSAHEEAAAEEIREEAGTISFFHPHLKGRSCWRKETPSGLMEVECSHCVCCACMCIYTHTYLCDEKPLLPA